MAFLSGRRHQEFKFTRKWNCSHVVIYLAKDAFARRNDILLFLTAVLQMVIASWDCSFLSPPGRYEKSIQGVMLISCSAVSCRGLSISAVNPDKQSGRIFCICTKQDDRESRYKHDNYPCANFYTSRSAQNGLLNPSLLVLVAYTNDKNDVRLGREEIFKEAHLRKLTNKEKWQLHQLVVDSSEIFCTPLSPGPPAKACFSR